MNRADSLTDGNNSSGRFWWMPLLLVLVTMVTFSEVRFHEFVLWDDDVNVFENPYLHPVTLQNVLRFWREPYFAMYVPVTRTVWAGLAQLSLLTARGAGATLMNPHIFHLANLAVHILNVLLVFAILRMLVGKDWPACAGALLFALHPIQVEPVAWVTGMKDLLGGFFALLALWNYLSYASVARGGVGSARGCVHYALATLSYVLALLSKPSMAAVPVIAWILDHWALKRPARQVTSALIAWVVLAVLVAALAGRAEQEVLQVSIVTPKVSIVTPIWTRPLVAADALAFYLYKLAVPLHLGPDYGRTPEFVLGHVGGYVTWLLPCALAALIWLRRGSCPLLVASAGVFVVGLLPVLGVIPFQFQEYSTVTDRYVYLAMLGPALALAWVVALHQGRMIGAICLIALSLLGFQSALHTLYWNNTLALFTHALEVNPNSWVSHTNMGAALTRQGKTEQAMAHFREALRITPKARDARFALGSTLYALGRVEEAAAQFREAVRFDPDLPHAHNYLAIALATLGKTAEARAHWAEALRLNPNYADAHHNLAVSLYTQGEIDQAIHHLREALRIRPDFAQAQLVLIQAMEAKSQQQSQP